MSDLKNVATEYIDVHTGECYTYDVVVIKIKINIFKYKRATITHCLTNEVETHL